MEDVLFPVLAARTIKVVPALLQYEIRSVLFFNSVVIPTVQMLERMPTSLLT